MRLFANACWACLFLILFAVAPANAAGGNVDKIGTFENNGLTAEIDTYTEGAIVVAVIAIRQGDKVETFAFDRNDWADLERLWDDARSKAGGDYLSIGSLAEKDTSEKCVILFAAGPTIRITVVSPIEGAMVFDVPSYMASEFEAKLRQAASVVTSS